MHDPQLLQLLYARQTLQELTFPWREKHLPARSGPGALLQAQVLFERGKAAQARAILGDLVTHAQESRVKLWAAKALRDVGLWPEGPFALQALGVVFEVPRADSKDILAVYHDRSVRFFSYSGAVVVYESADNQTIHHFCQQMMLVADQIVATTLRVASAEEENAPQVTVLTLSGEVYARAKEMNALLSLGAGLIQVVTPR